jgi:anaerobic ribonucleoside-triphosphate reductase activating protein
MLRILDITAPDINNGNGIRVTLWVAGCTHKCKGCHNSWTWNYNQGKPFIEYQNEILNKLSNWLSRDYVEGLTISGGDPLDQDNDGLCELYNIIKWVRNNFIKKTIWLYTGYTKEEIDESNNYMRKKVVDSLDVLVDGPYKEELRDTSHCPFRGSTNQRLIYLNNERKN